LILTAVYEIKRDRPDSIAAGEAQLLEYCGVLAVRHPGEVYRPGTWQPWQKVYPIMGLPGITGLGPINIIARNAGGGVIAYEPSPNEECIVWATIAADIVSKVAFAIEAETAMREETVGQATLTTLLLGF
jgi:hypothetical protein